MGPPPPPIPPVSVGPQTPTSTNSSPPLSESALGPNHKVKVELRPDKKTSWLPFPIGSQKITEIIKKRYDKPYRKFGDVLIPVKKLWFKDWMSNLTIKKDHERYFWKVYKYRTSKRLSQMLWDVHNGVGSYTYPSGWTKRSQDTHNRFKERLDELRAQHAEAQAQGIDLPPIDEDTVWEEVCGGTKKNRVYDKGAFFSEYPFKSGTTSSYSETGRPSSLDQTSHLQEEINKLNEEILRVTQQTDERIIGSFGEE
ncbi:hypothetical protein PIB30_023677 [Stylosanthes scabra]|uniref:Uncharacterized protein n=1 Tax=Stylosanthes scabra TaxID=79078 RepID=A0ABU6S9P7_9FABA|nr:hypothetical protein [Stylosanthes scabra]